MTNRSEYAPVECVNIPKMLFQEKQYEKLSVDAKLLYSLLLDRKTMANMNGWIDQNGTAYVVYPKSEMKKHLNAPGIVWIWRWKSWKNVDKWLW